MAGIITNILGFIYVVMFFHLLTSTIKEFFDSNGTISGKIFFIVYTYLVVIRGISFPLPFFEIFVNEPLRVGFSSLDNILYSIFGVKFFSSTEGFLMLITAFIVYHLTKFWVRFATLSREIAEVVALFAVYLYLTGSISLPFLPKFSRETLLERVKETVASPILGMYNFLFNMNAASAVLFLVLVVVLLSTVFILGFDFIATFVLYLVSATLASFKLRGGKVSIPIGSIVYLAVLIILFVFRNQIFPLFGPFEIFFKIALYAAILGIIGDILLLAPAFFIKAWRAELEGYGAIGENVSTEASEGSEKT